MNPLEERTPPSQATPRELILRQIETLERELRTERLDIYERARLRLAIASRRLDYLVLVNAERNEIPGRRRGE